MRDKLYHRSASFPEAAPFILPAAYFFMSPLISASRSLRDAELSIRRDAAHESYAARHDFGKWAAHILDGHTPVGFQS